MIKDLKIEFDLGNIIINVYLPDAYLDVEDEESIISLGLRRFKEQTGFDLDRSTSDYWVSWSQY